MDNPRMLIPDHFPSTTFEQIENRIFIVEWRAQIDTPEVRSSWYPALNHPPLPPLHALLLEKKGIFHAGGRGAQKAIGSAQRTLRHPLRPAACDDALAYRWKYGQWERLCASRSGRRRWLAAGFNLATRHFAWNNAQVVE